MPSNEARGAVVFFSIMASVMAWGSGYYYAQLQHADTWHALIPLAGIPLVCALMAFIGSLLFD